jgi:NAD(P)-dependent dehydrogenase (short-subunit alcohol dehydrogenase family)
MERDPLDGNIAIVTGGAGDLGRGICPALMKAGATVVALDIDLSRAQGAQRTIQCDVTEHDACAAAVSEVVNEFGGVDTLVNLAQQWTHKPIMEMTDEDIRLTFDSGPHATLRMMQLCYPHMRTRGGGAIINFGSAAGTQGGVPGEGVYAGAKEAIRGLTKHAAIEWGRDNIRANIVCPVATSNPERWGDGVAERNPMGRIGDPETDVGSLVAFLAGPGATFITGRTFHVDGGAGMFR